MYNVISKVESQIDNAISIRFDFLIAGSLPFIFLASYIGLYSGKRSFVTTNVLRSASIQNL
jgi:hypothetical protein